MLIGEYTTRLQEKNRTAMPKKLREDLEGEIVITRGYEGCLVIVDTKRWHELIETIETRPLTNQDVRNTKRFLVGGASVVEFDKQGRFVIPDILVRYAQLKDELVFVGIENWIELWDLNNWEAKIDNLSKNASDIAERLSKQN